MSKIIYQLYEKKKKVLKCIIKKKILTKTIKNINKAIKENHLGTVRSNNHEILSFKTF